MRRDVEDCLEGCAGDIAGEVVPGQWLFIVLKCGLIKGVVLLIGDGLRVSAGELEPYPLYEY